MARRAGLTVGIAVRGYLRDAADGRYGVQACPGDCGTWLCEDGIDLSAVDPAVWQPYLGAAVAVDILGWRPLAPSTWGGLKAVYR